MNNVIDIRPDISAQREITPHWLECRIEELMRECDLIGIPVAMGLYIDGVAHPRLNHTAADNPHVMCGVLDELKNVMLGAGAIIITGVSEEEEPSY